MRKLFASTLAAVMCISTYVFAADEPLSVEKISAEGKKVSITATNRLNEDTELMLTVMKDDETLNDEEGLYTILQKKAKAGEEVLFTLTIADERMGVAGTGRYIVSVQNLEGDNVSKHFDYADSKTVLEFVNLLKEEAKKVTDPDKAYELLLPIVTNKANAGALFSLGIDYDLFMSKSEEVCNEVLNLVYSNGLLEIDDDELSRLFADCFGVAVFNVGEREEGISISGVLYQQETPDSDYVSDAVGLMESSYDDLEAFRGDFIISYGLTTVNKARVGNMGKVLDVFCKETGECENEIEKILNASSTVQNKIYDYIVDEIDNSPVNDLDELEELLDDAYEASTSGTGSGGGGMSAGSSGNRKPVTGSSVGGAVGTTDVDEKPVAKPAFIDMTDGHWAYEAVLYLKNKGIVSGTDTGAFEPDRLITREEFTKMVILSCGIDVANENVLFADVVPNAWYVPYIGAAVENSIVNGISENEFGVGLNITRQDMSVMAKRALDAMEKEIVKKRAYITFEDNDSIADYALPAIETLYEAGIISGKGFNTFDPEGNATRAEAAKIIYEAFK